MRQPTDEETRVLNLARIDSELKAAETNYAATLREGMHKEITLLRRDIEQGMNVRAFTGPGGADLFRYRAQMKRRLVALLQGVKEFGRGQVEEELAKQ